MTEIDTADTRIDLERVIAALPPQQRRAVRLYARGYTYLEIGKIMGVSEGAVKKCFFKIREKMTNR